MMSMLCLCSDVISEESCCCQPIVVTEWLCLRLVIREIVYVQQENAFFSFSPIVSGSAACKSPHLPPHLHALLHTAASVILLNHK